MQWDAEIMKYVFQRSKLCERGTRPWEGELTDSEYEERALTLVKQIWNDVTDKKHCKEDEIFLEQVPR